MVICISSRSQDPFTSPKKAKVGERLAKCIWKGETKPIIALLANTDQPHAFAFSKDFYFELTENVKPTQCRNVNANPCDSGGPGCVVQECGNVLHEAGLLNLLEVPTK